MKSAKPVKRPTTGFFTKDDDAHWYFIPVGMGDRFAAWVEATGDNEDCPDCFDSCRIDHPGNFVVTIKEENHESC